MTPMYIADAFTDAPFRGNPAAVCFPGEVDDAWMAHVAAEMNLSETAFLWPEGEGWRLRWRTPTVEVDLCGHATLASAHVLWSTGRLASDAVARFQTRSGALTATRVGDAIELDFPATRIAPAEAPPALLEALGVDGEVLRAGPDWMVVLPDEASVRAVAPDFRRLRSIDVRGVMVTAPGDEASFVSRFFAPGSGIDEDPVTGSAHCALCPYWSERLGKAQMTARQLSARGGRLDVELRGDRVVLQGQAVTILEGNLAA